MAAVCNFHIKFALDLNLFFLFFEVRWRENIAIVF